MRNEFNLGLITDALLSNCGDFYGACKSAALSPSFVRKWMKEDDKVKEEIECAAEVGAMQLESAAIKRAVHGVEEDVFYQGEVCGTTTKYSDSLLQMLLKKRMKQVYGDDAAQTNVNVNVLNAIQSMPRAKSYEEWLGFVQTNKPKLINVTPLPDPLLDPAMADIL
jgi:hypothetical protein